MNHNLPAPYSLITGRGATAIYLALQSLTHREVIVPANICYAAILPIYYSGNLPKFIDIDYPSGNSALEQVASSINNQTGAILYPHMYSNVSEEVPKIRQLCDKYHILLIEDCASAMGGTYADNSPVGIYGDFAIFSTGHAKNVDLQNGGILFSKTPLSEIQKIYCSLPFFRPSISKTQNRFSHHYSKLRRSHNLSALEEFFSHKESYRDLFLYQINDPSLIQKISESFTTALSCKTKRRQKYQLYLDHLPSSICYQYSDNSLPWRFSILIDNPQFRQKIISTFLEKHLFISDWYPCIAPIFGDQNIYPNAIAMEQQILNFLLLDSDEQILTNCAIINSILQG